MHLGFSPDYDVSGITDPFLQVQFLTLLRLLAAGDRESSDSINDILAQVAANTDVGKNSGTAVLYEAVRTIMEIEADNSLRVLAINTLGRFLVNQDNNVRYIALNLLNKAIQIDVNAVQRHRNIIVECLRDPDISIRRRALELIYVLINESNVRVLVRELLVFLEAADNELKPNLTMQICISAEKYAPNRRWHFDTVLRVLKLAGAFVREQILSSFIHLVSSSPDLQPYMVRKLYSALKQTSIQESLVHAASWCIGEYGDLLVLPSYQPQEDDTEVDAGDTPSSHPVSEEEIVSTLENLIKGPFISLVSKEYILTALAKLCARFPRFVDRIGKFMESYRKSQHLELQQRALEYCNIIHHDSLRSALFERMPVIQTTKSLSSRGAVPSSMKVTESLNLLDLDISSDLSGAPSNIEPSRPSNIDLLADLFATSSVRSELTTVTDASSSGKPSDIVLGPLEQQQQSAIPLTADTTPRRPDRQCKSRMFDLLVDWF
jgi:AP-1 complex subunit gamma-1